MSLISVNWRKLIAIGKYIYTPLILVCIIFYIIQNRTLLIGLFSNARPLLLISAVLLWSSLHLLSPLSPLLFLKCFGYSLPYKELLHINISRLPARYLPGGIWQTVGRLVDYHSYGVTKRHLAFLAFFETFFPIPASLFIGGTLLWFWSPGTLPTLLEIGCSIISFMVLLIPLFVPKWIALVNLTHVKSSFFYIWLVLLSAVFWFLASASFFCYFQSVSLHESIQQSYFSIAGAYIFSWGVGYIAIFAPQGIGVFEVVAGKIINLPMGLGSTIAFLAGFRLIALMADISFYFLYNLIRVKK